MNRQKPKTCVELNHIPEDHNDDKDHPPDSKVGNKIVEVKEKISYRLSTTT